MINKYGGCCAARDVIRKEIEYERETDTRGRDPSAQEQPTVARRWVLDALVAGRAWHIDERSRRAR